MQWEKLQNVYACGYVCVLGRWGVWRCRRRLYLKLIDIPIYTSWLINSTQTPSPCFFSQTIDKQQQENVLFQLIC